jgi:hypothetical protein
MPLSLLKFYEANADLYTNKIPEFADIARCQSGVIIKEIGNI